MGVSRVGRWLVVNQKHDDYASTSLTLGNVTNTTRLYGGEKEKEMLFFKRKNTRASSFYHCFTIYTHFLTFIWW